MRRDDDTISLGQLAFFLWTFFILIIFYNALAYGQVHQVRVQYERCLPRGKCERSTGLGSAVIVGRFNPGRQILLTARHVIDGAKTIEVSIDGRWYPAVSLGQSEARAVDIAAIGVSAPDGKFLPIAAESAAVGSPVQLSGHARGGPLRTHAAKVLDHGGPNLWLDQPSIPGDSGGAVIDQAGQLVGIISATDGRRTLAVDISVIRSFAMARWQRMPHDGLTSPVPSPPASPSTPQPMAPEPPTVPPLPMPGLAELEKRIGALEKREAAAGPRGPPGPPGPQGESGLPGTDADPSKLERALELSAKAAQLSTWFGVPGAIAGLAGLGLSGLALRVKKRREADKPPQTVVAPPVNYVFPSPAPPPVVSLQQPPLPQQIIREPQFTAVERNTHSEAYAYAAAEIARQYPGSIGTIESINGLMNQFLASKGIR